MPWKTADYCPEDNIKDWEMQWLSLPCVPELEFDVCWECHGHLADQARTNQKEQERKKNRAGIRHLKGKMKRGGSSLDPL